MANPLLPIDPSRASLPESRTETFAALKLSIDNWRWAGFRFICARGREWQNATRRSRLVKNAISIFAMRRFMNCIAIGCVIRIQPTEGISLSFGAKVPGPVLRVGSVDMSFEYSKYFNADAYTGYEVLLYDCMIGDATLFQRADMVEAGWTVVDPVLDVWKVLPPRKFPNYAAGLGVQKQRTSS